MGATKLSSRTMKTISACDELLADLSWYLAHGDKLRDLAVETSVALAKLRVELVRTEKAEQRAA